jgi:hypothetical protein
MLIRRLIPALPDIVIVSVNPGLCGTNLGRNFDMSFSLSKIPTMIWYISIMRKAEVGARNLTYASVVQDDSCEVSERDRTRRDATLRWQGRSIKSTLTPAIVLHLLRAGCFGIQVPGPGEGDQGDGNSLEGVPCRVREGCTGLHGWLPVNRSDGQETRCDESCWERRL